MSPEWTLAGVAVVSMVVSTVGAIFANQLSTGQKLQRIEGKLDVIDERTQGDRRLHKEEDEHCSDDRHAMRNVMHSEMAKSEATRMTLAQVIAADRLRQVATKGGGFDV